ncbi:MAG: DUF2897 family protein [Aliidiomarina sp.]|uniref:DUF2897 family protein n=1 Tax=Aliidiomarina sp. TaxID=1872439 RepID=UPI0025BD6E38|nr:DUF2897 family protein [Aliidiomarina sp.]MCH8501992.1 DUF2897 family protein [Aliidiomarina sp.]
MSIGAWLIIILALGIILSNIMLLKKTANMKMPKRKEKAEPNEDVDDSADAWDKDNWGKDDWQKDNWDDEQK